MSDWTVEEARAYLPRVRQLLAVIRQAASTSVRARSNGHAKRAEPGRRPRPAEAMAELEEGGIVVRDIERGLIDFPSRSPSGRQVLLCWQSGELDLAWWHLPEDGFAGRRPLPLPPEI